MIVKEACLKARELGPLKAFYQTRLQLPLVRETKRSVTFAAGRSLLTFETVAAGEGEESKKSKVGEPIYHIAFNVRTADMESAAAQIAAAGIELNAERGNPVVRFDSWEADSVYFADPAGNVLELIHRERLEGAIMEPYAPSHVASISEIGLAVRDVNRMTDWLLDHLAERVYLNGRSDSFTPIGDEEGLLIVSSEGRRWLGSEATAQVFPIRLVLDGSSRHPASGTLAVPGYPYEFTIE